MKHIMMLGLFMFCAVASANPEIKMRQAQCSHIECDDLKGEEHYRCRVQQKNCYKRVFEEQLAAWSNEGIRRDVQRDVTRSLEAARDNNRQVVARLKKEIEIMEEEIEVIDEQLKKVRALRSR